jgi:hypothetical protein
VLHLEPNPTHEGAQNCVLSDGSHSIGAVLEARAVEAFERSMAGTLDPLSRLECALIYPEPYEVVLNMSNRQFCLRLASFQWAGAENSERIGLPRFVMEDPEVMRLYEQTVAELQQHLPTVRPTLQLQAPQQQPQQQSHGQQPQQQQGRQQQAQQWQAQQQQALMQMLGRGVPYGCAAFPVEEAPPHHVIPRFLIIPPDQEAILQAQLREALGSQGSDSHHGSDELNSAYSARSRPPGSAGAGGRSSGNAGASGGDSGSRSRPIAPTPLAHETRRGAPPAALPFSLPSSVKKKSGARTATRAGEGHHLPDGSATSSAESPPAAAAGTGTEMAQAGESSSADHRPAVGAGCLLVLSQAQESPPGCFSQAACPQLPASQAPCTQAPFTQAPFTQAPFTQAPFTQAPFTQAPFTQMPFTQMPFTQAAFSQVVFTQAVFTQAAFTQAESSSSSLSEAALFSQAPFTQARADLPPAILAPASQPPATQAERPPPVPMTGGSPASSSGSQAAGAPAHGTGSSSPYQPLLSQLPLTQYRLPDAGSQGSDGSRRSRRRVQQKRPWEMTNSETDSADRDGRGAEQHGCGHGEEVHAEAMQHETPIRPRGDPLNLAGFDPMAIVREVFGVL